MTSLSITPKQIQAIECYNRGVSAMTSGATDEAIAAWLEATVLDPLVAPAFVNLALASEQQGNDEEAVRYYESVIALSPFDTRSLVRQGACLARLGRHPEAIARYERAISIYPYFRTWYEELADILASIGDVDGSRIWRQRARNLDTVDSELALDDGMRNLHEGKLDLAEACFEAVLEDHPANLDALLNLAALKEERGQFAAALEQYEIALELTDAARAWVHVKRALLHLKMGAHDAANLDLEFALDHNPDYGLAGRLRDELAGRTVLDEGWKDQLSQILKQTSLERTPSGLPPRVALVCERDAALSPMLDHILSCAEGSEWVRFSNGAQPLYVVETGSQRARHASGLAAAGWMKSPGYPKLNMDGWAKSTDGMELPGLLSHLAQASGAEGFNLVILVSRNPARGLVDATRAAASRLVCGAMLHVVVGDDRSFAEQLASHVNRWSEVKINA